MSDEPIFYLNYRFDKKEFQTIFFGQVLGSAMAIAAKLEPVMDGNLIVGAQGDFGLKMMGGTINFALDDVKTATKVDSTSHFIDIRMNIFSNTDQGHLNQVITFERPYNLAEDQLVVEMRPDNVTNWKSSLEAGMFSDECKREADWFQSCRVNFS